MMQVKEASLTLHPVFSTTEITKKNPRMSTRRKKPKL